MEHSNPPGNDKATPEEFAAWLRDQLERRGYDLRPRGGGQTRFATDSGIGTGTISRMLNAKQGAQDIRVLELLATALGLQLSEVLVAAGILSRDELAAVQHQGPRPGGPLTPEQAAAEMGINDPDDVEMFVSTTEFLRRRRAKNHERRIAEN
ncbi:helix-turn-helix domain-containing protein [Streptomyces caeruleatus]|uniref:DNA-binding protein n=1 Tax=Streptomyces caeruleatus TaxID=661399 RepID=A0A124I7G5_9ACTN|nr:helix-turn-helix transcriptional regulator [Streptomyces caeruleatus]KUN96166.1 DNA-binding protein [Streptomyces caeruleatus]